MLLHDETRKNIVMTIKAIQNSPHIALCIVRILQCPRVNE